MRMDLKPGLGRSLRHDVQEIRRAGVCASMQAAKLRGRFDSASVEEFGKGAQVACHAVATLRRGRSSVGKLIVFYSAISNLCSATFHLSF